MSAIDLTVQTRAAVTEAGVNEVMRDAAQNSAVFGWTEQPLVSADLRARPESIVMCGPETNVSVGGLLRVFGWYDNEWGFSTRMIEMARRMAARST